VSAISLTSPHLGQSISGNPVTQSTGNGCETLALALDPRLRADKACPMSAAASEQARPGVGPWEARPYGAGEQGEQSGVDSTV